MGKVTEEEHINASSAGRTYYYKFEFDDSVEYRDIKTITDNLPRDWK